LVVADHFEVLAADLFDAVLDVLLQLEVLGVRTEDLREQGPLRALQEVVPVRAVLDREERRVLR